MGAEMSMNTDSFGVLLSRCKSTFNSQVFRDYLFCKFSYQHENELVVWLGTYRWILDS